MNKLPKIRFKDDNGNAYPDWEVKRLGEVFEIIAGGDVPKNALSDIKTNEFNIPILSNGVNEKSLYGYTNQAKIDKPSITISARGTIGWASYQDKPFFPIVRLLVLTPKTKLNVKYSYYFMKINENSYKVSDAGIPQLTKPMITNMLISIPCLEEQTKIADFLSLVDERISKLEELVKLKELYKKGIMQKIFSQKLRFKDDNGNAYPDWEVKSLGEVFIYKNGGAFESYVVEGGAYKLITLNSIDINGKLKNSHKTINITDNSLNKNDLVIVLSDVAHGNFLGLCDIIDNDNYVLNQRMGALKPKIEYISTYFTKEFINYNQKYFKLKGQGSSQQNLSKKDIEDFKISLPCLAEQTKIAEFLSAIDKDIDLHKQKLEQTKLYKKALLQQLLV